jgi:transcription elongation factor GreA
VLESTWVTVHLHGVNRYFFMNQYQNKFKFLNVRVMAEYTYYTREGLDRLRAELHEMKTKGRTEIARQIADARDKGDLSENAEYDAAKDAQGMHELKIAKLEDLISKARVLDESKIDLSKVSILSKVKIKNTVNGATLTYTLVSEEEADLKAGRISVKSPFGEALLGKEVGQVAEVKAPKGVMKFEVIEISR